MSCQKCGGEHSTMACDDADEQPKPKAQSSFAAPTCSANPSDLQMLNMLRKVKAVMPPAARKDVETIETALRELVNRHGNTARIALILYVSELVVEDDSPNDGIQRPGSSGAAIATEDAQSGSL